MTCRRQFFFQIINDSIKFLTELELKFTLEINTIGSINDRENYTKELYNYFKLNENERVWLG